MLRGPAELLRSTVSHDERSPILVHATVMLLDAEGQPTGDYLSGDALNHAIEQLMREVIAPINDERRTRLRRLANAAGASNPTNAMADAIIEPLFNALCGPNARVVHFCYEVLVVARAQMPRELWWTGALQETLKVFHARTTGLMPGWKANLINKAMYMYVHESMTRSVLPLQDDEAKRVHEQLQQLVRCMLGDGTAKT